MPTDTSGPRSKGMKRSIGGQEVKGQGHARPKIDLEAQRRHRFLLPWVEVSSFALVIL